MSLPALTSNTPSVPSSPPTLQAISGLDGSVTGLSFGILRPIRVGTGVLYLCDSKQILLELYQMHAIKNLRSLKRGWTYGSRLGSHVYPVFPSHETLETNA